MAPATSRVYGLCIGATPPAREDPDQWKSPITNNPSAAPAAVRPATSYPVARVAAPAMTHTVVLDAVVDQRALELSHEADVLVAQAGGERLEVEVHAVGLLGCAPPTRSGSRAGCARWSSRAAARLAVGRGAVPGHHRNGQHDPRAVGVRAIEDIGHARLVQPAQPVVGLPVGPLTRLPSMLALTLK